MTSKVNELGELEKKRVRVGKKRLKDLKMWVKRNQRPRVESRVFTMNMCDNLEDIEESQGVVKEILDGSVAVQFTELPKGTWYGIGPMSISGVSPI